MAMNKLLSTIEAITNESTEECDLKRENGNINGDASMATMLRYGSECSKEYVLHRVLPKEFADAHIDGKIHIHDLDFYLLTTTCCQIDLNKLFTRGFDTGHGYLREPQSITTAAALAAIAIQSNQNDQHGGQSIPAFDYMLAPYVRKSFLKQKNRAREIAGFFNDESNESWIEKIAWRYTEQETEQAMEAFVHNLNTMHSRAGAQVPFSSINYGTDTSREGRLIIRAILDATKNGMGNHETPIFPIQIFKCKKGINQEDGEPNYDLFRYALEVSGLRMYPNFSFLDSSFNEGYLVDGRPETETSYMGCRTRVIGNRHGDEQVYGRGNLSFTTINLPGLALEFLKEHPLNDAAFIIFRDMLDDRIDLVVRQMMHRYNLLCDKKNVNNYPFLLGSAVWYESENLTVSDNLDNVLKHGTLSVGFIGLAETCKAIFGKYPHESDIAAKFAYDTVEHMRHRCDQLSQNLNKNVTLLATPAEGLSGRFTKLDREKYGEVAGVNDREYYTNSFHVPVWHDCSIAYKLDYEGKFHKLCNAGHISYVEVDGNAAENIDAMETIVKAAGDADCGYAAINHPIDFDPICGYTGIINDVCPKCGRREDELPKEQ